MSSIEAQIENKRQEFEALKKIVGLTDTMKVQLDALSNEVTQMHSNADSVSQIMLHWDSIMQYISQASLGLQKYSEGDYNVGTWDDSKTSKDKQEDKEQKESELPLPETLIRMKIDQND
ncbi:hypothetical protein TPHA_0J01430 [Tetrapisispora phaffii CBS 4417]|uniref:DASH complex subunit DAD2 n=1 Tax=Tetrapisispora phaffii (strain ATCC 24235 / CBS 4417 / NBRC 1672 / NRRL Y-8282 / UCD 70-5) TaxID=1071381 RepID=G8BYM3_TETPH|nr:hypothetical protein TPHA_0J01430 [Tetrapisispora phaffii CBS 4417]CCE64965.1 hypothetical protein TPHA_0J01430 [Tetrapisispora phaffii CBS 4417]